MKIKACPFCGGSKLAITDRKTFEHVRDTCNGGMVSIKCCECDAEMPIYSNTKVEKYEKIVMKVIRKWNQRGIQVKDVSITFEA